MHCMATLWVLSPGASMKTCEGQEVDRDRGRNSLQRLRTWGGEKSKEVIEVEEITCGENTDKGI